MRALFVTGAGTEIGKTYVSCALLAAWRAQGIACAALKPVVSGIDPEMLSGSDPALLLEAMGERATAERIAEISPWRFAAPLAPPLAARVEGRTISFDEVVSFCRNGMSGERVLIEGAGGIMAPLTDAHTNLDLIAALGAPVLFVAGSYLGAVSHALTGLEVLAVRSIPVAALVVSESEGGVGLGDTCAMIRAHAPGLPVISLPRGADGKALGKLLP